MKYSKIVGTGGYLPPTVFTNADWEKRVDTSDEWIVDRTGIHSRHIALTDETSSHMAAKAAQLAMTAANCDPKDIQLIIVATGMPDKIFPATACLVQKQLQIPICIAFDIQAACTGFIYALSIADQYIKTGAVKCALVIGSELMSRLVDWSDRNTCILFGDGAGAVVLQASSEPGILSTDLYAQGDLSDLLVLDNAQCADLSGVLPGSSPTENYNTPLSQINPYIQMQGQKVFKIAVTKLGELVEEVLKKHQLTADQIDWLIPHQANIRILKATAEKLGLPMEKVICTVATHSNTSSASIPLALDVAIRDGRVKKGQTLLFEAFGGGLTWGSALVKY
ncbi:MAG: beta-ketoacyl-ACP synthase III [Candidatus Berkiellales bacterium]